MSISIRILPAGPFLSVAGWIELDIKHPGVGNVTLSIGALRRTPLSCESSSEETHACEDGDVRLGVLVRLLGRNL